MKALLQPWQLLLLILAGWVNRGHQDVITYLIAENRVLRQKPGKKRILLNDNQRRLLGVRGKILGRKILQEIASIATPDTILRCHRELVSRHWDFSIHRKNTGRPPLPQEAVDLTLKLAKKNPRWGYTRIQGVLQNLGKEISDTAVANVLKEHGIDPAPDRKRQSSWRSFLNTHWDVLASVDFTTIGKGTDHLLPAVLYGNRDTASAFCRSHLPSRRRLAFPGCQECNRRGRRIPPGEAILVDGSRCEVL